MFYLLNLFILIIYYFLIIGRDKDNPLKRKRFATIACIHIVLFRALADPYCFVDTGLYDEGFSSIADMSFHEAILQLNYYTHWGHAYILLNWIIGQFTDNSIIMFIVVSIISIVPVIFFYYQSGQRMLFPLLVYLAYPMMFYQGMGVLRQHLSVAIILLVLYYLGRPKFSIPLTIIACLMHTSGIVILPFLFIYRMNINEYLNLKGFIISAMFLVLFRYSMWNILSYMPKYMDIVSEGSDNNIAPIAWMGSILFLYLLDHKRNIEWLDLEKKIMAFFSYGFVISLCCLGLNGMGRFTIFFYYVIPLASMVITRRAKSSAIVFFVYAINVAITLIMLYYSVSVHNYDYKFFWE